MSLQDILKMPVSDRLDMLEQIWNSINPEEITITSAQKAELDRRIALHESGESEWLNMDEVKLRLDKKIR